MGRAQRARCPPETAGGGRPTLADRPSLLPRGMERARVRRGIPHPPQPDTRSTLDSAPATFQVLIPRPRPFRRGRQAPVSCHAVRDRAIRCGRDRPQLSPGRASRLGRAPGESHLSHLIPLNPGESRLKKRVRSRGPGRSGERRKTEGGGGTQAAMTAGSPSPPSGGEGRGEVGRRAGCGLALVANVSRCFASASSRD